MILALLVACAHTPPHAAVPGRVEVAVGVRDDARPDRRPCHWEAEALVFEGRVLVGELLDPAEGACPDDRGVYVDRVGQDGPFVSVRVREEGVGAGVPRCMTLDLRTGAAATLVDYDPKWAEKRLARAARRARKEGYAGEVRPEAFLVDGRRPGDGHVRLCVPERDPRDDPHEIVVR